MPQTKNNYNFIDYKQPILPNQTDYRTSYYRGEELIINLKYYFKRINLKFRY